MSENSQIETDNQQERYWDKNLGWIGYLAGIIDGEGSICINTVQNDKYYHGRFRFMPQILIGNSNRAMLEKIVKIYKKMGINTEVIFRSRESKYYKKPTAMDMFMVVINNQKDIRKVLSIITPFLVAKHKQAVLMKKYLDGRLKETKKRIKQKNSNSVQRPYYRKIDIERVLRLKILNHPNISSETTRQAFLEKISKSKNVEKTRMKI